MNLLSVSLQQSILALAANGWSARRIARELNVHRETVGRWVRLAKPATVATGSTAEETAKPATVATGSATGEGAKPATVATGSGSSCEPWREQIVRAFAAGLSATRIHQDLVAEHGFAGRYNSVKRFVRQLRETAVLPFRRMECAAGEEMQVDFGQGAWVESEGKRSRPHVFRVVLSHSRKGYSEAVSRQDTETFLRCLENSFRHFGGVPKTVVVDNLKAAVLQADWYDPELNPKLRSFAAHYGTVILPTKPRTPEHKGKVEAGVKYVQNNALKGRKFASLAEQNLFLAQWERTIADTRIHGTVRQQVAKWFESSERPALQPLPPSLFPSFHEAKRTVHQDGHVEYQKAYYSVPPEFLGRPVWVRADSRLVRIFSDRLQPIAVHPRSAPGRFCTAGEHLHPHKRNAVERGSAYLLQQCQLIGEHSGAWAEAMLAQRGVEGIRVLQGLLQLARKHPVARLEQATAVARRHGAWRLQAVRRLLATDDKVIQLDFLQEHPLIRPLDDYRLDGIFP
jgi:transposase